MVVHARGDAGVGVDVDEGDDDGLSACGMDRAITIAMDRSIGHILVVSWIDP